MQFNWPVKISDDFNGVVDVDDWWGEIDQQIMEASLFSRATPTSIDAHTIAPWIPPACRGPRVWNTEVWKGTIKTLVDQYSIND